MVDIHIPDTQHVKCTVCKLHMNTCTYHTHTANMQIYVQVKILLV